MPRLRLRPFRTALWTMERIVMLEKGLKEGTLPGMKDLPKAPEKLPKGTDEAIKGLFKGLTGK